MLVSGAVVGGRFRVVRTGGPAASSIAVAEALDGGPLVWLVEVALTASEAELARVIERQGRFALGVPGLVRPVAWGLHPGGAFLAYQAAAQGSVAELHESAWPLARVAALATRIARALAPLHEQGIAHGCLVPQLVAEGELGGVLFGFGVAAVADALAAPGEASQLLPIPSRAPELRAHLLPATPASDVFALGVLLRGLLQSPGSELGAAELPPAIDRFLARAAAPEPSARPSDVRAFAAEFEALAAAETSAHAPAETSAHAPVPLQPDAVQSGPSLTDAARSLTPADKALPEAMLLPSQPLPPLIAASAGPQRGTHSGIWAWVIVLAGLLLMVGGVAAAFVYAARSSAKARSSMPVGIARSGAAPTLPPAAPAPPESADPPRAGDALAPSEALPPAPGSSSSRSHAPLLAPGVGPASYPEEAHSVLPITGSEPIWGTRKALLTWVLFGDLECPHTRRTWRTLEALKATYGDDLRIVFRHRPLREHPHALEAARVMAGLSRRQGAQAFFDVLHRVARSEASLSAEQLASELAGAGYANLPLGELAAAGDSAVHADLQWSGQFALKSTPYSYLNGRAIEGDRSVAELEQLLSTEQRSVTWLLAAGLSPASLYAARTNSLLIGVGEASEERFCAPIGTSPTFGPAAAPVTVVEFSDFECQYCKSVEPALKTLLARYPKSLRLVWKDFPLPQHRAARLFANFAAEARRRGDGAGFWKLHDALLAQTEPLDDAGLRGLAAQAGLDGSMLLTSARAGVHEAAIRDDVRLGEALGVTGTPTFFINGRRIPGALALDQFDALIQSELGVARRITARGIAAGDVYSLVCD